jgi:ATP-dependent RNA helicase RhlB
MPLRLIRSLAARLLGGSPPASRPAARPASAAARRPERPGKADRSDRSDRPDRPDRPERPDRSSRETVRHANRHDDRHTDRRDDHRGGARPADRRAGRAPQGHTPSGVVRPGGDVGGEERVRRQTAHAAWNPSSYQVAPAAGKRRFQEFDLPSEIVHAIADLGFQYCTPIQALSLEHALAGRNVAGRAQTGTGKTAAFLIAILTRYLRQPAGRPAAAGSPRALVIAPTRELVIQICRDADALGRYCGLRYLAVYGGMDHDRQRRELAAGPLDLLVATPGRLLDYVNSRAVSLSAVDTLVIDEADRMLDMGFIPDVRRIVRHLPPREKRCTMLYSATLTEDVMRLASQWMTEPCKVEVEPEQVAVDTVTQQVLVVTAREKLTVLGNLLRRHEGQRVLVFCNRRDSTERVSERLRQHGFACEMLSGDVQQNRRLRVLDDFRAGRVRVVVATDVAGRGIHVEDIGFVVNYDFPYEPEDYVHRIGRTGRAGQTGTAISFADENESFIIPEIEKYLGEPLKCSMPGEELLRPLPEPAAAAGRPAGTRDESGREGRPHGRGGRRAGQRFGGREERRPAADGPHAGHAPEWPESAPSAPVSGTSAT